MDIQFTPQEEAFRKEVQAFLKQKLNPKTAEKVRCGQKLTKLEMEAWHAALNQRSWFANHWPKEYGGPGWTPVEKFIFDHECALVDAPPIVPFGVTMLGPVLIKFGNEAQKKHWLPRILKDQDWWCQGYSEPGAGSDLASLKTTAVRQGDHYVVNGQKTWTTSGHHADMIFCLVRTDREAKPQEGISFLLIDLKSPGVEIRPIILLNGEHDINEVFFTDVKVPVENLVGQENHGWSCAKYLLTYERTSIGGVGLALAALDKLKVLADRVYSHGKPLSQDPLFAARMARVEIDLENMKTTNLRVIAAAAGGGAPGAESSMLKIRGSQIRQEIFSLTRRAAGPYAIPYGIDKDAGDEDPAQISDETMAIAAARYFNHRKLSIYGGSNEIQKNIISKMILGL